MIKSIDATRRRLTFSIVLATLLALAIAIVALFWVVRGVGK
jgi:hypothetical protein